MVHVESVDVGRVRLSQRVWANDHPAHPPVVLLPATGNTAADWDGVAAELSQDRVVRAIDLRGHGDSDWPGEYSLQLMAADIVALVQRCDEQPDLVGHSLGGLVACLTVAAAPEAVRRLALEDVPMPHPRPPARPLRPRGRIDFDWQVIEQVRPELDNPDSGWADVICRISVPTLVIAGGSRSTIPQQHVAELVETLALGQLATVDAGHLVHATKPQQFLKHLTAFLAD